MYKNLMWHWLKVKLWRSRSKKYIFKITYLKTDIVSCDLDNGDMTLSQGHDTFVWYIIKIQHDSEEL